MGTPQFYTTDNSTRQFHTRVTPFQPSNPSDPHKPVSSPLMNLCWTGGFGGWKGVIFVWNWQVWNWRYSFLVHECVGHLNQTPCVNLKACRTVFKKLAIAMASHPNKQAKKVYNTQIRAFLKWPNFLCVWLLVTWLIATLTDLYRVFSSYFQTTARFRFINNNGLT